MGRIRIKFSGRHLPRKDILSKSDPFLCVLMASSEGNFQVMAKTNWIKNDQNPDWDEVEVEDDSITPDNFKNLTTRLEILDYDGPGKGDVICSGCFTLADIEEAARTKVELTVKDKKGKDAGHIIVNSFAILQ